MSGIGADVAALTGRISTGPDDMLLTEVLLPQLRFEAANLTPSYVRAERVLLLEYHRMQLLSADDVVVLNRALDGVDEAAVLATAGSAMTDTVFAVERIVTAAVQDSGSTVPAMWHVDRSRNDLQATAQLMYGRGRILDLVDELLALVRAVHRFAQRESGVFIPGYTHSQPAQVMTADFYATALGETLLHTLDRLKATFAAVEDCPLGAGAMTGGDLIWDRDGMAALLGFSHGRGNALRAVATRDWALETTAELALLGVPLSRFVTDLMTWAGGGHGFLDLPDAWSGISSAMPQKKNFPVLERIRARTAHLTSAFLDVATAQRSTPFSNTIEVSKEAGAGVPAAFDTAGSVLRLLREVLDVMTLRRDQLRVACETDHLGAFRLANALCMNVGIPWRDAQVLAGRYVVAALASGLGPSTCDGSLLGQLLSEAGSAVPGPDPVQAAQKLLDEAFDIEKAVADKKTSGSTARDAVAAMCDAQAAALNVAEREWAARRAWISDGDAELSRRLAAVAIDSGGPG
ncbi:argininosuccinate lyase [Rhodococcoides fascians A25f]|uniref:argininosuccinate lyase n=1 Tax=Rhodococcoides fascians TaxID=1828 RepID=UPI00055C4350|nr:lyase family protein [Rhodococcus fascians]QII04303.1 argininosuccinate lyase [Rhodococcus fascians A25f]